MESYNKNQPPVIETEKRPRFNGRVWAGVVIVLVGTIWIAREAGADIPRWITSGPMFLVAVGVFIGASSNFRNWVWLIPVGVGVALIADRYWFFDLNLRQFIWPAVIVVIGLVMIFRPRKSTDGAKIDWKNMNWGDRKADPTGEEDVIDAVSVFGSTKKNILSKNFRGGEMVNFFGGSELNLMQADINGPVLLDLTQVFGGAKLIVPSNWRIQSELVSVFGGVDDKRLMQPNIDPNKVLILRGTNVFGGLEIKSY